MATNRDDINKMSNEELAATIMAKVSTMPRFSSISGFTDAAKEIAEWLSEPFGIAKNHIQVTKQECEDIYENILVGLNNVLNKEKTTEDEFVKPKKIIADNVIYEVQDTEEENLKECEEKNADQMFEDLGYRIDKEDTDFDVMYYKFSVGTTIRIGIKKEYREYVYAKIFSDNMSDIITEKEDIAIHKKISEMEEM